MLGSMSGEDRPKRRRKGEYTWVDLLPSIAALLLAVAVVVSGGSTEDADSSMRTLLKYSIGFAVVVGIAREWQGRSRRRDDESRT